jgi:hypothetical protein
VTTDPGEIERELDRMPFGAALAAIAELANQRDARNFPADITWLLRSGKLRLFAELRDEGREWALAIAKQPDVTKHKLSGLGTFAVIALLRAKESIDEHYPRLFHARANYVGQKLWHEITAALGDACRDAVLAPSIQCIPNEWVAQLLEDRPSPVLGRAALRYHTPNSGAWNWWVERLRRLGEKHPAFLEVVTSEMAAAPPAVEFTVTEQREPKSLGDLTAVQQQQLSICGKRYDGRDLPASARIAEGGPNDETNPSFRGLLEFKQISDAKGNPVYDVFLYAVDAGTVFKAETTEVIADIVQTGVMLLEPNVNLRVALQIAVWSQLGTSTRRP